jgi:hypothetical protein
MTLIETLLLISAGVNFFLLYLWARTMLHAADLEKQLREVRTAHLDCVAWRR